MIWSVSRMEISNLPSHVAYITDEIKEMAYFDSISAAIEAYGDIPWSVVGPNAWRGIDEDGGYVYHAVLNRKNYALERQWSEDRRKMANRRVSAHNKRMATVVWYTVMIVLLFLFMFAAMGCSEAEMDPPNTVWRIVSEVKAECALMGKPGDPECLGPLLETRLDEQYYAESVWLKSMEETH